MDSIKDSDFQEKVLNEGLPVLLDFWAEWCMPCKMMAPVLEDIGNEYEGKVKIMKMNIDENQETPGKFGITSIPTMLVFKKGEQVDSVVGAVSRAELAKTLDKHV